MSRAERAKEYFLQGYNCSQAVALAFQDVMGVDEKTVSKLMLPFGGGLGRLRLTCGAVSGMAAAIGAIEADAEISSENKKRTYAITQALCNQFKTENGSLICGELLAGVNVPVEIGGEAEKRTESYYKKRPCAELVACAANILETYLKENGKI